MNFMFPRTKFVDENTIDEQLKHLESELEEVKEAKTQLQINIVEELFDLIHSAETAIRIIIENSNNVIDKEAVDFIKDCVIMKNIERGYYNKE